MHVPTILRISAVVCLLCANAAPAQEILVGNPQPAPPAAAPDTTAAPAADRTWSPVLIVTDDGWNLADVSVRWLVDGSRVRITRPDGSWKDFLPWNVSAVYAADGTDLTAVIAAARPGATGVAPPAAAPPTYNEVGTALPVHTGLGGGQQLSRPFTVAVTAGAGYGAFAGDWYEGFEASPSLQAAVRIGTGRRGWLALSYRRQGGGRQTGQVYDYVLDDFRSVGVDLRVDEYLLMAGTRTNTPGSTRNVPYTEFGVAVLNHSASYEVSGYGSGRYSELKLGMIVQIGGLVALGDEGLILDVGVDAMLKPSLFDDDEAGGFIFGLHAGIGYIDW